MRTEGISARLDTPYISAAKSIILHNISAKQNRALFTCARLGSVYFYSFSGEAPAAISAATSQVGAVADLGPAGATGFPVMSCNDIALS